MKWVTVQPLQIAPLMLYVSSLSLVLFLNKRGFERLFFSKTPFAQKEHWFLLMEKKQNDTDLERLYSYNP